jgi:hypothetical protein
MSSELMDLLKEIKYVNYLYHLPMGGVEGGEHILGAFSWNKK